MNINQFLHDNKDEKYRQFQCKLMPTVDPDTVIGIRVPLLRKTAKTLFGTSEAEAFLSSLPHQYYDENNLHAFLICLMKNFDRCIESVEAFLPHVDNWATCDMMTPKVFKKHADELLPHIERWLAASHTYTVRFGIKTLMDCFLDSNFDRIFPEMVAAVKSEEYYVNMMIAWYFATALAKQYDAICPYLEQHRLDVWTHNKTIQKAVESYRITDEQKKYLKTLKMR